MNAALMTGCAMVTTRWRDHHKYRRLRKWLLRLCYPKIRWYVLRTKLRTLVTFELLHLVYIQRKWIDGKIGRFVIEKRWGVCYPKFCTDVTLYEICGSLEDFHAMLSAKQRCRCLVSKAFRVGNSKTITLTFVVSIFL